MYLQFFSVHQECKASCRYSTLLILSEFASILFNNNAICSWINCNQHELMQRACAAVAGTSCKILIAHVCGSPLCTSGTVNGNKQSYYIFQYVQLHFESIILNDEENKKCWMYFNICTKHLKINFSISWVSENKLDAIVMTWNGHTS